MRSLLATWFPRVNEIIMLIGSHNLLATPSRRELDDPELRPLLDEFLHGAKDIDAEERAALFRLAWDFVGSSLGRPQRALRALLPHLGGAQPHQPPPPQRRQKPRLRTRRRHPGGRTEGGRSLKAPAWSVYVLRCADGSYYTGITNDLSRRLDAHRAGKASKYTRARLPLRLACVLGSWVTRGQALRHEARIKTLTRREKHALVRRHRAVRTAR